MNSDHNPIAKFCQCAKCLSARLDKTIVHDPSSSGSKSDRSAAMARLQNQIADWIGDEVGVSPVFRDYTALAMARVAMAVWENDRTTYPQNS